MLPPGRVGLAGRPHCGRGPGTARWLRSRCIADRSATVITHVPVAQLEEQRPSKPPVGSSNLSGDAIPRCKLNLWLPPHPSGGPPGSSGPHDRRQAPIPRRWHRPAHPSHPGASAAPPSGQWMSRHPPIRLGWRRNGTGWAEVGELHHCLIPIDVHRLAQRPTCLRTPCGDGP